MSYKRRRRDAQNHGAGGSGNKRLRRRPRKKHLYLVLDDWKKGYGYSIHKMDPDTFDSDDEDSGDKEHNNSRRHLPEPPALRLEPPAASEVQPHTDMSFAALGTKLFALMNHRCGLVYDAGTAVLSVGAHVPAQMVCGHGVSLAIGDVLYVLSDRYFDPENPHSFAAMSWGPTSPDANGYPTEGWSWKALPPPPLESRGVLATALHPDGRTIFMTSTDKEWHKCTYSFDTVDSAWRRCHEKWALPFLGHGHFDAELDAWVGMDKDGHVCAGRVVSPGFRSLYPDWYCKKTEEKMFSKRRSMGASLTYMGASNFCLVDCVAAKHAIRRRRPPFLSRDGFVINLT